MTAGTIITHPDGELLEPLTPIPLSHWDKHHACMLCGCSSPLFSEQYTAAHECSPISSHISSVHTPYLTCAYCCTSRASGTPLRPAMTTSASRSPAGSRAECPTAAACYSGERGGQHCPLEAGGKNSMHQGFAVQEALRFCARDAVEVQFYTPFRQTETPKHTNTRTNTRTNKHKHISLQQDSQTAPNAPHSAQGQAKHRQTEHQHGMASDSPEMAGGVVSGCKLVVYITRACGICTTVCPLATAAAVVVGCLL